MTDPDFSPFEVSFKMERADYVALCFAMRRRAADRLLANAAIYLLTVALVALIVTGGNTGAIAAVLREAIGLRAPWWIYPIIPSGFLFAVLLQPVLLSLKAGHAYRRLVIADREICVSFETEGLQTILTNFESWISWHAIERIIETSDHLFLTISRREALILPRRAFATDADYHRLLGLVRDRGGFAN